MKVIYAPCCVCGAPSTDRIRREEGGRTVETRFYCQPCVEREWQRLLPPCEDCGQSPCDCEQQRAAHELLYGDEEAKACQAPTLLSEGTEGGRTMLTYGEMLREWRTARGMSQRDLAAMASCDHTYLSKIESGALDAPSDDLSRKLAMALSINPDLLINLSAKAPQDWGDTLTSNPRGVQVLRLLATCRYSDDTYEVMRQAMLADLGFDPFITSRSLSKRLPGDSIASAAADADKG